MDLSDVCMYAGQVVEDMADQFGDEVVIRNVAIILNIDQDDSNLTLMSCDDDRRFIQEALLDEALATVTEGTISFSPDDDD